jgi:hypothetical protein
MGTAAADTRWWMTWRGTPAVRNEAVALGIVVVRAEERHEFAIGIEGAADPHERVRMDFDVGVHEHESFAGCPINAEISSSCWGIDAGIVDDNHFIRRFTRAFDCSQTTIESRGPVCRRNDRRYVHWRDT